MKFNFHETIVKWKLLSCYRIHVSLFRLS